MTAPPGGLRVGTVEELKAAGCKVVSVPGSGPVAVFWHGGRPYAVDNRCPHMGFPLHQGTVEDGILTCHWHHARFDLASGCTFDLFADDVPAYPVEVRGDGSVYILPGARGRDAAVKHAMERLREGLEQAIPLVLGKAVLALEAGGAPPGEVLREAARFGARYRAQGFGMGLTILAALANVRDALEPPGAYEGGVPPGSDRFLALYHGLLNVAFDCEGAPPRFRRKPFAPSGPVAAAAPRPDAATIERWFRRSVEVRDRDGAERCLVTALADGMGPRVAADLLFTAATDHIFLDGGHIFDFANKAFELLDHVGFEAAAAEVLSAIVPPLVGAERSEESSAWRQPVDLVPLRAEAAAALPAALAGPRKPAWDGAVALLPTLLGDDPRAALDGVLEALRAGAAAADVARAVALAAAWRVLEFGKANEHGDWITVLHTFTYANAVHQALARRVSEEAMPDVARGILDGALKVYLDRFLNVPPAPLPSAKDEAGLPEPAAALRALLLDTLDAQQRVDEAGRIVSRYLRRGHPVPALVATLGRALLREDAEFHSIQMLEAGVRQVSAARNAGERDALLVAVARYLAAHSPTPRERRQTAEIALRLHRGEALHEGP